MTVQIARRQAFDVCADTYWRELCLSVAFQQRLYCEALGFQSMEVLQNEGDYPRGVKRRLRLIKPVAGPAPVLKVFGSVMAFEEDGEFDPIAQCWRYRMIPARMADRLTIHGSVRLEPRANGVEQITEDSVSFRMLGLSGVIEPFMARESEQSHADRAAFTQRYIAENQLR